MKIFLLCLFLLLNIVREVEAARSYALKLVLAISCTCAGFVILVLILLTLCILQRRRESEQEENKAYVIKRHCSLYSSEVNEEYEQVKWNQHHQLSVTRTVSNQTHSSQNSEISRDVPIIFSHTLSNDNSVDGYLRKEANGTSEKRSSHPDVFFLKDNQCTTQLSKNVSPSSLQIDVSMMY